MNILNKLTIKHLMMNKKRTIVSIVGIILSTALMVGIGLICSTMREFLIEQTIMSSGKYHANIEDVKKENLVNIESNSNIKEYYYEYGIGYAKYEESENEYKPYFYIDAVSENFFEELKLIDGTYPKDDTEIIISNHIFSQGKSTYKVGDVITLEYGIRQFDDASSFGPLDNSIGYKEDETFHVVGTKTYKIVGICERSNYEAFSSPGFYFFTKANEEYQGNVNLFLVYHKPSKVYELSQTIYKNLGKELENDSYAINYHDSLLSLYGVSSYGNFNDFLSGFLVLFLSIISVACTIVIYNSFAISVMERKKQFGLFSSIGATKGQIRKTVFYEAFIVGSIGIILGIISAYVGIGTLGIVLNNLLKNQLDNIPLKLTTYPLFIVIPIIFIIIVIIVSAFIPAKRASKISPIEVIRQNDDIKIKRSKIKTPKIIEKIFGIEGVIALKNIKRNKKKYRVTLVSLFISITTFIAFSSFLKFGMETANNYVFSSDYDVEILVFDTISEQDKNTIEEMKVEKNVEEYVEYDIFNVSSKVIEPKYYTDKYKDYYGIVENQEVGGDSYLYDYVNIIKLDDHSYQKYLKKLGASSDKIILINSHRVFDYNDDDRKVLTFERFNSNLELSICNLELIEEYDESLENDGTGDYYYSISPSEYDRICSYRMDNFYYTNELPSLLNNLNTTFNPVLIVNESTYEELKHVYFGTSSFDTTKVVGLKVRNSSKLDELAKKLGNHVSYTNIKESEKSERNAIVAIKILLYGFISLVTLIGITSVFNTITTSISLRKREFSILRSVGLTPQGFNKMIWFESIFFGLKSLLYALPVGIVLSILIADNMNTLVEFHYSLPLEAIMMAVVGVFVIVLITMWYSTSKMKKENILESIREENI